MAWPVTSVAIVGAGIAGLSSALCLARKGISSTIFEQAETFSDVGAGLQLSPNASRILFDLGLSDALEACWSEPESIVLASGRSLRALAAVPAGKAARARWAAPYGVLHRASLQAVLLQAVEREPLCRIVTGRRIDTIADIALETEAPALVIGADGVWSRLRQAVPGTHPAHYSGNVAWRFLMPFAGAPAFLDSRNVTAFLGVDAHMVVYPLAKSRVFNIVAIHRQKSPPPEGWSRQGDITLLSRAFAGWHREIAGLIAKAEDPVLWPLYQCPDGRWTDERSLVLIGDAAHAMTPFAAQGAAMAIEDSALLAPILAASSDAGAGLRRFESVRRERVARVRRRGAFNHFAYHARGPVALARDLVLKIKTPESLAGDLDWLYGYRTPD